MLGKVARVARLWSLDGRPDKAAFRKMVLWLVLTSDVGRPRR